VSLDAEDIRNEKVKVLRSMKVVAPEDVVMGQYRARGKQPGYLDDKTVPEGRCGADCSVLLVGGWFGLCAAARPQERCLQDEDNAGSRDMLAGQLPTRRWLASSSTDGY
jgi:hypothetical protein